MPWKSKDDKLAYQRRYYHQRKSEYTSNPGRIAYRKAGMNARTEILDLSYQQYLSPSDVEIICRKHAFALEANVEKTIEVCTRTLVGAMDDGVFLGSVLFGSAKSRRRSDQRKIERFRKLIKQRKYKNTPELLILQIETEDQLTYGRESTYDVW